MSDKFFFNGRQDARLDPGNQAYQTRAGHKGGSKKYPLALVVTNDARKQEVEALVTEAELYAEISVDSSEGAEESIAELSALLNKGSTVKLDKTPTRNEPCSCGSGKKYKKCCGSA
jgi:SWIM/SEC-C metal-binding protein